MTAGAQDYASEVLYPDDLIPVEDLDGKINLQIKLIFLILNLDQITPMPIPPATTTTTTTTSTDEGDAGPGNKIVFPSLIQIQFIFQNFIQSNMERSPAPTALYLWIYIQKMSC